MLEGDPMKYCLSLAVAALIAGCGNPGDLSDADYAAFKELASPKILYRCKQSDPSTFSAKAVEDCSRFRSDARKEQECIESARREPATETKYRAGVGFAVTYNKLLSEAKQECSGGFELIEGAR
jgi:hypothetical protein